MRAFVILLLIIGGFFYYAKNRYENYANDQRPPVITNPVYADVRLDLKVGSRELEGVFFVKTASDADCQSFLNETLKVLTTQPAESGGMSSSIKSTECTSALEPRYEKFFNNEPSHVTYLTLAPGNSKERETRLIYWGVSVEESEKLCGMTSQFNKQGWKGKVECVHAIQE